MAITTQDGLLSALGSSQKLMWNKANVAATAGRPTSLWTPAGQPGAGSTTLGQAATGAVPTDADVGAHPFTNPVSGNSYAGQISGISAATGLIVLYDLLWVWGSGGSGWSVTTTTAQSTSSPAALTRPDANGSGTEAWLEVLSTLGAGAATPTLSYTNSASTAGRTTSGMTPSYAASAATGSCFFFNLQAGDTGVKSIQSLTTSVSMTSGTARICIGRRVAELPCVANVGFKYDAYALGLPQIYNDACLVPIFFPNSTASGPTVFSLSLAQG